MGAEAVSAAARTISAMPYVTLDQYLPDVARREMRSITTNRHPEIPDGDYLFVEAYCNESNCLCHRAYIHVYGPQPDQAGKTGFLATISFGWESEAYCRRWAKYPIGKAELAEFRGPALVSTCPQSRLAPALLRVFEQMLEDFEYAKRIVRHDRMFQAAREIQDSMRSERR